MATQENPIDKLYSVLNRDGLYTKDINSFKQKYSTPQEVEKLYKVVNRDGYYTKDYNSFKEKYFPKSNEVSTQGSKNTSQTSTEPSLISQSNPFGKVPIAKTINVATGKVGTEKVSSGSTKASKSLYADALLAVQSPIQTTSDLLTKGLGKVADGIFGEPRKTLRDRILEADTPNTTNKVGKAYDAEYLKTVSETSQANQLADNIEKSGQPKAKEIASGIRERNKQWFNLPVSERKEIREFDKSVNEEKNLQNLEAFNAEHEKLTNEIWQEKERLKNTVSGVGSRKDFQKLNLLNNRLNELKVKQATLELKPQLLKSQIFKNDDEIIQNLGEELEVALENIKENDPSKYERFSKKLKFGLSSVSEGDKKDLIREALAIKQENLANNYNQLYDSGAVQMVNNYVKEVAKYNTAVESGDEQTVRQSEQLIKTYKEAGVDGVIDNINYLSTEEEHINDIVKTSDVKYDIFSDQRRQKEVDKFVKDNPTLGRLWEAAKSVYSIIPKTVKSGAAIGSEIGNIISRDSEASRKMVGVQKFGDFIEALTPTMAELKVVNKDGSVNYNNIPTATAETLSTMAVLLLGGSKVGSLLKGVGVASKASSSAGLIASSFALSKQDYYETGIKEGLKSKDATLFANQSAMLTSLLELISPNDLIVTGKLKSEFTKEFVKYFTKNGFKYAMSQSTKRILKEVGAENIQEISQMLGDKFVELAYNRTNKTNFKENIDAKELKETIILTTAATGILTGINNKSANKQERLQYFYEMSKDLTKLKQTLDETNISEDNQKEIFKVAESYNKAHNAVPSDLDEKVKSNVVPLLVAKQKLQDDANQENIDPAFKTAINEKIKIIDQTIVGLVNGKFDPKKVVITDDPKEAVKNTEEAILEGSNVVEEIGLEEGNEIPTVETTPSKVETTQDVKVTEEVTTPTEVKSTEKVIVEVGNVEYETDGTYVSEKGSGNLMPLDSDVSVKVLEKYSEIKPTETKVEEVKVTENVKTTQNDGKADSPTKENINERLNINHPFYKKVSDALSKLGIIQKYNPETGEGDVLGGYSQPTSDGGFSVGGFIFTKDGSISFLKDGIRVEFDKNGNVISENTSEVKIQQQKLEVSAKKESIKLFEQTRDSEDFKYKTVNERDVLGNIKKVKRLKTPQELRESTDKINAQIDKVKSELADLEQSSPTPTQETVQVKPKFTIKGETVTPKIDGGTVGTVEDQQTTPSEEVEVSGIKKSLVSKEVVDKVDFDKISDKEFTELGKKLHETGEVKSKDIVREIVGYTNKEGKKTEGNRRALQPSEVVALLYYKTDLDNQERDLLKKKNSILEKGGDTSSVDAELNEVQNNIFDFDQMALITADQQSLAFRLRKGLIDKDYNYVTQVEKYKATNKGVIPADVEARFKEYDARLKELKEKIIVAEERARIAEEQVAVNNIVEDVKREQSNPKVVSKKDIKAKKELADAKASFRKAVRGSLGQMNSGGAINLLGEAAKLIKAYAKVGVVKIEDVLVEIAKDFGKKFTNSNEKLFRDAHNEVNTKKQLTPEQKRKAYISKLNRDIADLDKQIEERKRKLKPDPTDKYANDIEITELRELRDFKKEQLDDIDPVVKQEKAQLTQEELDAREVERKIKANEKSIQDLKEKIANPSNTNTKNTSLWTEEVGKLEVEKAKLRKELAERRKSLKPVPTQEEIELKQVEDKIKSTEKSIEDLERKLSENDLSVNRKQSSLWTKEIGNLEQKKKNLQKELEDRRKAKTPADIAKIEVDMEIKRVERAIQTVKEKIDGKKITKKNTSLWTKEIGELNQQKQELQEQLDLQNSKPYIVDGQLTVPSRYIRGLVESGVTDINSISEQVLAEVQKDLPDATIREVRDAITRYGKTVNQTADVITTQINQAKSLGRLYSKLEDLQKGIVASKTATRTTKLTKEQIEIKKQIKVLEDALPKTEEQIEADNTKRLEAKKRYYERFIQEKEQRLKDKNFAPKAKSKPIVPDDELSKLQAKANEVRAKYDEAHFENEQTNRPLGKKIYDESLEWLTGLTRALQAGLDLSAFGVQLAIYTSSTTPSKVLETVKQSLKFLSSEKYEKEFFAKIETHPLYPVMKASGLALQYPNSKLGSRDYQLSGSAINKVYNAMVFPLKYINPKLYERAILFNPYRATERAFTGAIDTARIQMFTEFAKDLEQNGISFENNPEQYKIAAEATNNLTFRGKLGRLEGVSRELAVAFFAPRKVAASLALVNPIYYAQVGMGSKVVAKRLLLKMATFISVATMLTLLIKATQDDEDEDSNPDVFNPYSSDFMKVRLGNTRIDMFGGLNQNIVFFARQIMGLYKKTSSYKTEELGGAPFVPTRLGLIGQFTKNKLAPTVSLTVQYLDQSKGREVDWDTEAVQSVSPMWTTSINELYKEHSTEMASFLTFMALIGQSMNTYGTAEFLDKDKDKKYLDLLARKNGAFQNRTRASIKIIDEGTGEERGIDRVEYEVYKKEFGDYIKSDLKARYKELDNMTLPEFEKELKKIKKNAKEFAEFKLTNSVGDLDKINQTVKGKQVNYVLTPEQIRQRLKYNDSYISKFGNKSMPIRIKKFMQRDKLTKELAEKEALIEMNKSANKYSERMLFRDYRAGKIKLEIK